VIETLCRGGAIAFALCLLALLAACLTVPPLPAADRVARAPASSFVLEGRLAASDGEQAVNGRLEWIHAPAGDQWTMLSPFGQLVARLADGPEGADLQLADGRRWHADNAAALIPALFPGFASAGLPPELLAGWVQAAPRAGAEARELDALGRPALLIDEGWRIEYLAYDSERPDAMPRRFDISRGEFRLRLIIDSWQVTRD
jgi:outer membrane lipoprotein LolB